MIPYTVIRPLNRVGLISHQIRFHSTVTNITYEDFLFKPPVAKLTKVIREAEKLVGYPTSFMNLRWLLSDEFANMAMHMQRVVGSNHPILQTAKSVIYNEHNYMQPWGLMILLLSKALQPDKTTLQTNTVMEHQRILAEITEMIRTGHYVHRGLLNIPIKERDKNTETAMYGNKLAILIGDYLLVTANRMLAQMKNNDISYLISTALRDISEGEFFGDRDSQNMPLPGNPRSVEDVYEICTDTLPLEVKDTIGSPIREWTLRTMYGGGSLFGRGCQGALLLGGHNLDYQHNAYLFASHVCLAWQAANELHMFTLNSKDAFSLVSAPVLFALNDNPDLYNHIDKGKHTITNINFEQLKMDVLKTDAIVRTRSLYKFNVEKAIQYIETFGKSIHIDTIKKLINT